MNNHENLVNKEEKKLTKNDTTGEYTEDNSSRQNELTKEYSSPGFGTCGDSNTTTSEQYLKILDFRHFERFFRFDQSDRKTYKKAISDGVNVSVVLDMMSGSTSK